MKSEREIREHRDALDVCRKLPCGCAGTRHEARCVRGGDMMTAAWRVLCWALGEADGDQGLVDHLNETAARARGGLPPG